MTIHSIAGARYASGGSSEAIKLSDEVYNLTIYESGNVSLPERTGSEISKGVYLVANSNECFIAFGGGSVTANSSNPMLSIGERILILEEDYVSVLGIGSDSSDAGVISLTRLR